MTNVADKLRARPKRWPWLIAAPATALLVVGTWAGASALTHSTPTPTATAVVADSPTTLTGDELDSVQQIADTQQAALVAEQQAAAAAAQAAAAAAAKQTHQSVAAGDPGSRVPFIASSDPNNANGGDYEDPGTYCHSGSASGSPPVCD